jgi:8-amino-7-oxononanoate synthase
VADNGGMRRQGLASVITDDANGLVVARALRGKTDQKTGGRWLDDWLSTKTELAQLRSSHPMVDAVIDEIDGRLIRIGNQWLIDFASSNYLGFDLEPQIIDAIPAYLARWGTHPGWSRLRGSTILYEEIESELTELLGCEDSLVLPTVTHIHTSVIPALARAGTIFVDGGARKTVRDACAIAGGQGATVCVFGHDDPDELERLLRQPHVAPRLVCIDGINNMTGNAPDLPAFASLAREYDALLYVDDSHGFGVVGERASNELCDYGLHGNSVIRHVGETYENVVVIAGFSKAYSSLLAYIACPTALKEALKTAIQPYVSSGPSPVASLATALEGLRLNRVKGDELRLDLYRMTKRVLGCLQELGIATPNVSGYPIIEIPLANHEEIEAVGGYLFHHGIYATMAVYPLVPHGEASFRLQITAANTMEQIENLITTIGELTDRFRLRSTAA